MKAYVRTSGSFTAKAGDSLQLTLDLGKAKLSIIRDALVYMTN